MDISTSYNSRIVRSHKLSKNKITIALIRKIQRAVRKFLKTKPKRIKNGFGVTKYSSGSSYMGYYENNMQNRCGRYVFKDSTEYIGIIMLIVR
jgi:hypothetical protein